MIGRNGVSLTELKDAVPVVREEENAGRSRLQGVSVGREDDDNRVLALLVIVNFRFCLAGTASGSAVLVAAGESLTLSCLGSLEDIFLLFFQGCFGCGALLGLGACFGFVGTFTSRNNVDILDKLELKWLPT